MTANLAYPSKPFPGPGRCGLGTAFDVEGDADSALVRDHDAAALTVRFTGRRMPIKNTRFGGNCPRIAILKHSFLAERGMGRRKKSSER
jgi:hypothetical protein